MFRALKCQVTVLANTHDGMPRAVSQECVTVQIENVFGSNVPSVAPNVDSELL